MEDEAIRAGESAPAEKLVSTVAVDAPIGDRTCMACSGALVAGEYTGRKRPSVAISRHGPPVRVGTRAARSGSQGRGPWPGIRSRPPAGRWNKITDSPGSRPTEWPGASPSQRGRRPE